MKISFDWLKDFVDLPHDAERTAELLTDLGLEVEGLERFEAVQGSLAGVVVGEVLTCEKHENADRLKVTTVNLGNGSPVQIVCGAPNVAAGQKVPVATVGTLLYTDKGESFKIKKGKIRGAVSEGMICAEDELGLGSSHDGIMVLDPSIEAGTPAAEVFELYSDKVFEIGLTPNRSDAMSHWGVARDLWAGLTQMNESPKKLNTPSVGEFHIQEKSSGFKVWVEDAEQVPRYAGLTITDLKVEASPDWLQNRLKAIGLSPINNVVDITNYVLHGLGQPLHAFDADQIADQTIKVQQLKTGTKFISLDGVERELHQEDIMICDGQDRPMCIGGVFGGLNSGVSENTKTIFLESAYFNPVSIRKTAKRHGLNTDASFRFERGIDPNAVDYALKRAAILMCEIAGGRIVSSLTDLYPKPINDHEVQLNFAAVDQLIGEQLDRNVIKNILASLDIAITHQTETGLGLSVPAYRTDVLRQADVVEELLRVYGYNNIGNPEQMKISVESAPRVSKERLENISSDFLVSNGLYEAMNNSLTKAGEEGEQVVELINALSQDLSVMRQSLLPGLLESIAYNLNRKSSNLSLFEFGNTYFKQESGFKQERHLGLIMTGNRSDDHWTGAHKASDFFFLKGLVERLLERLGLASFKYGPLNDSNFSEGIQLGLGKKTLVELGAIDRGLCKKYGVKQAVFYADIHWENLLSMAGKKKVVVQQPPKYPAVRRDLALLLDEAVSFADLHAAAVKTERKLLKNVELFDVYTGKNLATGKKSYALGFELRDENKTLNDKQIDKIMNSLQQTFVKQFGAELR